MLLSKMYLFYDIETWLKQNLSFKNQLRIALKTKKTHAKTQITAQRMKVPL